MHVFHDPAQLKKFLAEQKSNNKSVGFVPTMGALHQGHLSLVKNSDAQNDLSVVSIFVNPTQFNNPGDLQSYPREPEEDMSKLRMNTDCEAVFLPDVQHMYPDGAKTENIDLEGLDLHMEGAHRPGHFAGVATVVRRFFELVEPDRAYFGEKDFQQLAVIRHLVQSLDIPVEVIGVPTQRNDQGLALSSRNQLLDEEDKTRALLIYKSLHWLQLNYSDSTPGDLKRKVRADFADSGLELEYVEIADPKTLKPIENWSVTEHARAFIAAYISGVRLIDNLPLF